MAKMIPIASVRPNAWNPNRMPEETYKALVEDVKANGVGTIDPIHVRSLGKNEGVEASTPPFLFEIIDGEHRLKALREAGFGEIQCIIDGVSEDEAKAINYRKNKERGNMDPFKEAELFKSMLDEGLTHEELGNKMGVSRPQISQRISLLKIPPKVKQIVTRVTKSGKRVTATHLELIAPLPKPIQAKVAEKLADEPSSRELTKEIEKITAKPKPPEIAPEPVSTNDGYECPICGARHRVWHISDKEHKFELIKESAKNDKDKTRA